MIICCGESLIDMIPIEIKDNEILYSPLTGGAIFNTSIALGKFAANMILERNGQNITNPAKTIELETSVDIGTSI